MDQMNVLDAKSMLAPRNSRLAPFGFTLVELLVVITIIGILASLIVVAAVGALKSGSRTRIKAELNQIAGGFEEYKNKTTAYPPNCETDDTTMGGTEPAATPIDEAAVFNDLTRHFKQAFPRRQESDDLLRMFVGFQAVTSKTNYPTPLAGGITAGEAVVFWLGGFSSDAKYPVSGEGGPAYQIPRIGDPNNYKLDPIESRKWTYPFDVSRLGPRGSDGYFDRNSTRYVEYIDPKGVARRINFWQYTPAKSDQPYLYFDTSRHAPSNGGGSLVPNYDPPAATKLTGLGPNADGLYVYAFKKQNPNWTDKNTSVPGLVFINPDRFQVIHCGLPNTWDTDNYAKMIASGSNTDLSAYLLFPDGPFIGDIGETIVSFTPETKIEDAQSK